MTLQIRRTPTPNAAPPNGSLAPGQLAVEMASIPMPRLWVGTDPALSYIGNRRLVVDPNTLGGRAIATTTPADGEVLAWNDATSQWVPSPPATGGGGGTVSSITASTGITLNPNPITGTGSVALTTPVTLANGGTGVSAASNAALLTGIGAAAVNTLAGRAVATTAPTAGQVVGWNAANTEWEPVSLDDGTY